MNTKEISKKEAGEFMLYVRLKLSALWIVYMFLYIYTDYYKMYMPGKINEMISGFYSEIQITQLSLFTLSAVTIIPALMIFLTLIIKERVNRWVNIIMGMLHIGIGIMSIAAYSWTFWIFYCGLLICVAALIVLVAWRWPKTHVTGRA
ncbi:MAG: hypothetical protein HKM93_00110 [Desulfobacteraceae bacterium]|nr:hypothetical protein [Desulfobacteraceae bacterium]